jgi:hypothetical protein
MFEGGFIDLILGYHLPIIGIVGKLIISSVVHVVVFPMQQ